MISMRCVGLLIALAGLATPPWAAAQTPLVPAPPYYAMAPSQGFGTQPASPVQQQILQNYRTQLLQTQRESLQQNPSGLGREQLDINSRLSGYNAPAPVPYVPPPPPGVPLPPTAGQ